MLSCPVCGSEGGYFLDYEAKGRRFLLCPVCSLVYQEDSTLPDADSEKKRYEQHRNNPDDAGYVQWLQSFIDKAVMPWYEGGRVLDFGSGPTPVLTHMLERLGMDVTSYDPYFFPLWPDRHDYSLILLCEVLEHIHNPVKAFMDLYELASENGVISVRTQFLPSPEPAAFRNWWYKEDPTHIRFYNTDSLDILAGLSGWTLIGHDSSSLAFFKKNHLIRGKM